MLGGFHEEAFFSYETVEISFVLYVVKIKSFKFHNQFYNLFIESLEECLLVAHV